MRSAGRVLRFLKLCAVASFLIVVAACGSDDSFSPLSVTASSTTAQAGGAAIQLRATGDGAGAATWTLSGPGRLDAPSGSTVNYLPPGPSAQTEDAKASVSAMAYSGQAAVDIAVTGSSSMQWEQSQIAGAKLTKAAYGAGRYVLVEGGIADGAAYVGDGKTWSKVTPSAGVIAAAVAYGNGRFVIVGSKGTTVGAVLSSSDGLAWTDVTPARASGTLNSGAIYVLKSVVFANGAFTAVGNLGTTVTSTDGVKWIDVTVPDTATPIYDATAPGSNDFVTAGGAASQLWTAGIMIPPNTHGLGVPGPPWQLNAFTGASAGSTWTYVARTSSSACYPSGPLVTSGSLTVAGGYCGESTLAITTSGSNWTPPTSVGSRGRTLLACSATITGSLNPNFTALAQGGGRFTVVACGQILSSVNGTDWGYAGGTLWSGTSSSVTMKDIAYADGRFIAVGGQDVLISK